MDKEHVDTRQIIRGFIRENFLKQARHKNFHDGVSFIEGGIIDSVGVLELVAFLEETFGFRVEDEELVPENLDSVDKLVAYVEFKLAVIKS
jgi:acyl carrier protein